MHRADTHRDLLANTLQAQVVKRSPVDDLGPAATSTGSNVEQQRAAAGRAKLAQFVPVAVAAAAVAVRHGQRTKREREGAEWGAGGVGTLLGQNTHTDLNGNLLPGAFPLC